MRSLALILFLLPAVVLAQASLKSTFDPRVGSTSSGGDVSLTAVGASPNANGATLSGQVLTLQPASATQPGVVSSTTQTFTGAKTFDTAVVAPGVSPAAHFTSDLGAVAKAWNTIYTRFMGNGTVLFLEANPGASNVYKADVPDGASAIAHKFRQSTAFTTAGSRLVVVQNPSTGSDKFSVMSHGGVLFDSTDGSGTPGAATINKPSGQVSVAGSASSVVVTNSTVTTTSIVLVPVQAVDATCTSTKSIVPAAGSFTVTMNAACTGATKLGFVVVNGT